MAIKPMSHRNIKESQKNMEMTQQTVLKLFAGPGNPRNSEGAFLALDDQRLMYVYTRYCGTSWHDAEAADLAVRYSNDGGFTWSNRNDILITHGVHANVMSVSLLRLPSNRILLLYLAKDCLREEAQGKVGIPEGDFCCIPQLRYSDDDGKSWSPEQPVIVTPGYYVVNNDRLVRLRNGRLLLPVAHHRYRQRQNTREFGIQGVVDFYYSDDDGATWSQAPGSLFPAPDNRNGLQEPGVVELVDGRLMAFCRTDRGCQYKAFSADGGENWSKAVPAPEFPSPLSPLSMKRDPFSNRLVAVWNDIDPRWKIRNEEPEHNWGRLPLVIAFSGDDGSSWTNHTILGADPRRGYCYSALFFPAADRILVGYNCGGHGKSCLQDHCIKSLTIKKKVER